MKLLPLLAALSMTLPIQAADIVALCIGNNDYTRVEDQLDTPINDAELMKRTLEALPGGADVKLLTNASKEDIELALNSLQVRARGAKLALVFYSGHGMDGQPDGYATEDTFLLPVEATIPDVNYLHSRAIPVKTVLDALKAAPVTARAVILDCCRSGAPKATAALAGATKNFGDLDERVKTALGKAVVPDATLIAFAASPGRKAAAFLTESDENSPFTKFLTDQLATGTGNLRDLVETAAETTETATGNRQVPYVSYTGAASAIRQIVFRTSPAAAPLPPPTPIRQGPSLPESGYFSLSQLFQSSRYESYNLYSKGQIMKRVQQKLKSAGLYESSADGISGPATQQAIIEWQKSENLVLSGKLDQSTLESLQLTGISEQSPPPAPVERVVARPSTPPAPTTPTETPPEATTPQMSSGGTPYAQPIPGKPGFVRTTRGNTVDVRDFPPGAKVRDPATGIIFIVP